MQDKICWVKKVHIADEQLAQLVERGRQLHNLAVLDAFAWLVSNPVRLVRKYFGNKHVTKVGSQYNERLLLKNPPKIPA